MASLCSRADSSRWATPSAPGWAIRSRMLSPRPVPAAPPCLRRQRRHSRPAAASSQAPPQSSPQPREAIPVDIVRATSEDMLSACAALRIACFYSYPGPKGGAFLFGADAQKRDCESWLEGRMRLEEGRLVNMTALGMKVVSLAAIAPSSLVPPVTAPPGGPVTAAHGGLCSDHCQVPFWWRRVRDARMGSVDDVVGTLDIHVGARLPSEVLEGSLPPAGEDLHGGDGSVEAPADALQALLDPRPLAPAEEREEDDDGGNALSARGSYRKAMSTGVQALHDDLAAEEEELAGRRAYIFNVCTLPALRRRGIASKMIRAAHEVAEKMGVEVMYIHVEAENAGAQGMYKSLGYVLEKEEEEWLAERMGRPRRLLLRKHIGGSQAAHRA